MRKLVVRKRARNAGTFQSNEIERLKSEKRCLIRSKMSLNFGANPIKYIFVFKILKSLMVHYIN